MELEQLLTAIAQLRGMVAEQGIVSGSIPHTLNQLQALIEARMQGIQANLEQRVTIQITENTNQIIGFIETQTRTLHRDIDLQTGAAQSLEEKTTTRMRDLFNEMQLFNDVIRNSVLGTQTTTRSPNIELSPENRAGLEQQLTALFRRMIDERFSPMLLTEGFERLRFEDSAGRVFEPAIRYLFGPDGPIAVIALQEASHSPDFQPAMQALFGPSGKVADAATAAAQGTELEPAFENLETKIEEGVSEALDEAGQAAANQAGQSLGQSVAAGATALGNIFTSIPQMHQQLSALGEAWDKPLESTQDYMNLFSALGGTITQGVQMFQALAGVTQIASAAQAIFNAVMAMNPIVLIVMAVIVLIGLIVLLIVYWDEVCAAVRDNPWIAAIGLIFGPIGILIALIVLIASHWEEVKLAVLQAANFISIQAQRIAAFFVGIYTVAGQVWDIIVATAINAGIGIANAFISVGTEIQNFFIGVINGILEMYNAVAESAIGEFVGLEPAELIPEVDVETRLIPPREVPELNVDAAFNTGSITGGLEDMIAEQEAAVAEARAADESRRAADAAAEAAPPAGAPGAPAGAPALPGLPGGAPAAVPAGLPAAPPGLPRPALPEGAAAAAGGAGPVDASVTVNGGITVNISAERLEADAAELLSDDIIAQLQARLGSLRSEQDFRTGVR